jgi:hypothetical protein
MKAIVQPFIQFVSVRLQLFGTGDTAGIKSQFKGFGLDVVAEDGGSHDEV